MTEIVLRDWRSDDAAWYAQAARESEIQRYTTEPPTLTAADVATAIAALAERDDAEGYLIADAQTGERLGNIAVQYDGAAAEVSYWVAAPGRGRGVASAALRAVCARARARCDVIRLWTHADNVGSQRVAFAAGFRRDPDRDGVRTVKDERWPTLAFARPAGDEES
jgi:[ribosomal protein S5]-alanine N-acetyltransferase